MPDKYFVWRRSDGYVDVSANRMPQGWKCSTGQVISFEHLATFDRWDAEVIDFIEAERNKENV